MRRRGGGRRPIRSRRPKSLSTALRAESGSGKLAEALHQALSRNDLVYGLNEELKNTQAVGGTPGNPGATRGSAGDGNRDPRLVDSRRRRTAPRASAATTGRTRIRARHRSAVVTFPEDWNSARLWLAAEDKGQHQEFGENDAHFPVHHLHDLRAALLRRLPEGFRIHRQSTGRRGSRFRIAIGGRPWKRLSAASESCWSITWLARATTRGAVSHSHGPASLLPKV